MVLHDLGARVIKVERADVGRRRAPHRALRAVRSAYFTSLNCGKESIALDLDAPADRDILEQLLDTRDVVVENFRPGTMDKLGFGWDALHRAAPAPDLRRGLGFRPHRPVRAAARVRHGRAGDGRRHEHHRRGRWSADARRRVGRRHHGGAVPRGRGERGAVPPRDDRRGHAARRRHARLPGRASSRTPSRATPRRGRCRVRSVPRHPSITPFAALRHARRRGDRRGGQRQALRAAVPRCSGQPELAQNPLFLTNALRTEHVHALHDELERALVLRTTGEWLDALEAAGIPCGPLNDVAAVVADPHVQARHMIVDIDDPGSSRCAPPATRSSGRRSPTSKCAHRRPSWTSTASPCSRAGAFA